MRFQKTYKCFPISMMPNNKRENLEDGGKIIMPPSALKELIRLKVECPMLFKLTNPAQKRSTHVGVLEFVAQRGKCFVPHWIMQSLSLTAGSSAKFESVSLPIATFSKFKPQSPDFMEITNPKAVLENALRGFACLTTGDIIAFSYNRKVYELSVLETQPDNAVNIIECDMKVAFEAPVGHETSKPHSEEAPTGNADFSNDGQVTDTFQVHGAHLVSKRKMDDHIDAPETKRRHLPCVPDHDFKIGCLNFNHDTNEPKSKKCEKDTNISGFPGKGYCLKGGKI